MSKNKNYGFSKTFSKYNKRQRKWKRQRRKRGFDDTELWNLDITIAKFIIDRLRIFRKQTHSYPNNLTEKEWDNILKEIIFCFEEFVNNDGLSEEPFNRMKHGLELFKKHFFNL